MPSSCVYWSYRSGVSTPSLFSQSKNELGLTLNHLSILVPRLIVKAIFSPLPLPLPNLHTESYVTAGINRLAKKYLGVEEYPYRAPGERRVQFRLRPEVVSGWG